MKGDYVMNEIFGCLVDYASPLKEVIKGGSYDNDGEYGIIHRIPRSEKKTKEEVRFTLVSFHASEAELKKQSLRRASVEELLAFGAKHKMAELVIVARGSCWSTPLDVVDGCVIGGGEIPCIMYNTVVTIHPDVYGDEDYRQLAVVCE